MTTAPEFRAVIGNLAGDPSAAGITFTGTYESLIGATVTPPAGTIRQDGQEVGIFNMPDGERAATVDSWGSVASRLGALLTRPYRGTTLAQAIRYPLVLLQDESGTTMTTSAELSHRQADATWRLCRDELTAAGIDFTGIQQATRKNPDALLLGFPTAIPFGWWHSQTKRSQSAVDKANTPGKRGGGRSNTDGVEAARDEYLGYYVMDPALSRSARLFTAEFIALGVAERRRMAGKVDPLFSAVPEDHKVNGTKFSTLGLGSIPPTDVGTSDRGGSKDRSAPSDLTYRTIESHAFFSLAGLRDFRFAEPERARALVVSLTLLLYSLLQHHLNLRAGTELRLVEPGLRVEVARHGAGPEPLDLPEVDDLVELVKELGAEVGWSGVRPITITPGSPLGRIILTADGAPS